MIELSVHELKPGLRLARTVYRPNGEVLLTQGYALTAEVIQKLKQGDQHIFWVQEEGLDHIAPEELVPEFLLAQTAEELRQNALHLRKTAKVPESSSYDYAKFDPLQLIKDSSRFADGILATRIKKAAYALMKEIKRQPMPLLLHLPTTRTRAHYLFQHAADAAVVACCLGRNFRYSEEDLENLVIGTLLMDIGYQILPGNLAHKKDRLSLAEFNALKEHPTLGFEILRSNPKIPLVCAHVAYQHHERQDGGGYPRRLIGNNQSPLKQEVNDKRAIHRFAEIAAVADAYVALIKPKPGDPPRTPVEAIKFLLMASTSQLNAAVVEALIPMIPIFSVGSRVQIVAAPHESEIGAIAVVSKTNPERPDRPEITLLYDNTGQWIAHDTIDLAQSPQYAIQQISIPRDAALPQY